MTQLQYTPEQVSGFTIPQMMCLLSKSPPGERKLENAAEWSRIVEEDSRRESDWNRN